MFPTDTDFEAKISLETDKTGIIDEPPFHILFLGDWSGDGEKKDLSERRPTEIDRDNFDNVLQKLRVRLDLDLQNDGNLLNLEFTELDDFHPDNIFRQIPLFSDLRDLRKRLSNADTFNSAANEVRDLFVETKVIVNTEQSDDAQNVPAPSSDDLLDQILSGNSVPVASDAAHSSDLNKLLADLVRPHLVSFDENEQSKLLSAVDEATGDLMRKIIHHSKFQELEAAWRGLFFLVRRLETDTDLKVFILDVSKTELADNFKSTSSLDKSLPYRWLISDAADKLGGEPWALVCGNYALSANVEDVALLIRIAKLSVIADAPFISHIRPEILGIQSFVESSDYITWNFSDETNEGKLWATLRSLPESEYLGLAVPRFLVRLPYGADTDPLEIFAFEEFIDAPIHDRYLLANPAFACALLLGNSFSSNGWEMAHTLHQDIEGLPIHIYKVDGETITKPCAEVVFSQTACEKLMDFGLMPLLSFRNTDRVRLGRFQSISNPITSLKGKWQ
jgi:type VI secretion system protein ImpC